MAQQSIKKTDQISRIYDVRKAIFTFLGSAPSICEIMEFFAHIEVYHDIFRVCCNDSETVYFGGTAAEKFKTLFPSSPIIAHQGENVGFADAVHAITSCDLTQIISHIGILNNNVENLLCGLYKFTGDLFSTYFQISFFIRPALWISSKNYSSQEAYNQYVKTFAQIRKWNTLLSLPEFTLVLDTALEKFNHDNQSIVTAPAHQIQEQMLKTGLPKSEWMELYYNCQLFLGKTKSPISSEVDYLDACLKRKSRIICDFSFETRDAINRICKVLVQLAPVDFYNMFVIADGNDRIKLELGVLKSIILSFPGKRVGILNPSPMLMESLIKHKELNCSFAFSSPLHARILQRDSRFAPYILDKQKLFCDVIVFLPAPITGDMYKYEPDHFISGIYEDIVHLEKHIKNASILYALVPDVAIPGMFPLCDSKDFRYILDTIYILPEKVDRSLPAKKCLLKLSTRNKDNSILLKRLSIVHINSRPRLLPQNEAFSINWSDLLASRSIRNVWKNATSSNSVEKRSLPQIYPFSAELTIYYTVEKTGRVKAYMCKPSTEKQKSTKLARGLRIDKSIRTTQKVAAEDIPFWLEYQYMYDPAIRTIVREMPQFKSPAILSLKMYFFLNEMSIMQNLAENKLQAVRQLLQGEIGQLTLGEATEDRLMDLLGDNSDKKQAALEILFAIFTTAVFLRHIKKNPLEEHIATIQKKREGINEVRRALIKRVFEAKEEAELYSKLVAAAKKEPLAIALLIRLFTGISSRIVLALKWSDIIYMTNYHFAVINISRQLSHDGAKTEWLQRSVQYRKIPLVHVLFEELEKYKKRLAPNQSTYLFSDESGAFIRPGKLASYTNKVISELGILSENIILPGDGPEEMELDLSAFSGDIFATNFRERLTELKLDEDDACYLRGVTRTTTLYNNYVEMECPEILEILYYKLMLWQNRYSERSVKSKSTSTDSLVLRLKRLRTTLQNTIIKFHTQGNGSLSFTIHKRKE